MRFRRDVFDAPLRMGGGLTAGRLNLRCGLYRMNRNGFLEDRCGIIYAVNGFLEVCCDYWKYRFYIGRYCIDVAA